RRRLVRACIEVPGASCQRVQKCRSISAIDARKDVGGIGGPEKNSLSPKVWRPGSVDLRAVGKEPSACDGLGKPSAFFPGGRRGRVAKPGKPLKPFGKGSLSPDGGQIEVDKPDRLTAKSKCAGQQRVTALAVALDVVARNGDELEWLAIVLEAGKERAARK